ncbi:hypothetical protein D9619_012950 [Psilocybe cf. subviscida]|uniref:Uncharacterized protein n=1 Tax=Psilocybe cf. subviscida TaxID=2480587 RepID=A0A8H5BHZ5_9AGAR|nr:hypothetical protein D9619_012950 [Psilocybe cf. subviscida]
MYAGILASPFMSINNYNSQFGVEDNCGCSQGDSRTIIDIVWSCLITILSCTWVSMHTNIPHPDATEWQVRRDRLYLTIGALVAPEIIVLWAMRQWIGARLLSKKFEEYGFSTTHAHFFQMGGFMLYKNQQRLGILSSEWRHLQPLLSGQDFLYGDDLVTRESLRFQLPTKADIQEKSKGDLLSKTFVVGQTMWFISQCVARRVYGLVVTELELETVAFAALNCIIYFLWWDKPLGVRFAVPVVWKSSEEKENIGSDIFGSNCEAGLHKKSLNSQQFQWVARNFFKEKDKSFDLANEGDMEVSILFAHTTGQQDSFRALSAASLLAVIFGTIHCFAWNFIFPTAEERMLWRVSAIVITVSPLVVAMWSFTRCRNVNVASYRRWYASGWVAADVMFIAILALASIYITARLYLLFGVLWALRKVPPDALSQLGWVNYIPHI